MGRRVLSLLLSFALGAACAAIPLETGRGAEGAVRGAIDAPALGAVQPRTDLKVGRRADLQPRASWSTPPLALLWQPQVAHAALVARLLELGSASLSVEPTTVGARTTRGPPRLSVV